MNQLQAAVHDILTEMLALFATARLSFPTEEEYVKWQRAVNHWETEARTVLAQLDDAQGFAREGS